MANVTVWEVSLPTLGLVLSLGSAALVCPLLAVVASSRREGVRAASFAAFATAVGLWAGGELLAVLGSTATAPVLALAASAASIASTVGAVAVPGAWLAFALASARDDPPGPTVAALLAVEPAVILALLGADVGGGLLVADAPAGPVAGLFGVSRSSGWLFWAHLAYSLALFGAGAVALARGFARGPRLYRDRLGALAVAIASSATAVLLRLSGTPPFDALDPTPAGLAVGAAALFWTSRRGPAPGVTPEVSRAVRDAIDEGIVVLDRRNRIVDVNATAAAAVGVRKSAAVGLPASAVVPGWDALEGADDLDEPITGEVEAADGRKLALTVRPVQSDRGIVDRGVVGSVVVLADVTERVRRERRLERSRERLEVLDRLLRHDLRNELNIIMGTSELLREDPEDVGERAETIERTAARLLSHCEKIRHIEWSLHGDQEARPIELSEIVRNVADWLRSMHPEAEVSVDCPSEVWVMATESLPVALRNVVENGVVHDNSEDPRVSIEVLVSLDRVTVRLSDDGPGIPQSELSVLERGAETKLDHLSGIGLWLVEWIVDDAGGDVGYEMTQGEGTTVTITLPATSPGEAQGGRRGPKPRADSLDPRRHDGSDPERRDGSHDW